MKHAVGWWPPALVVVSTMAYLAGRLMRLRSVVAAGDKTGQLELTSCGDGAPSEPAEPASRPKPAECDCYIEWSQLLLYEIIGHGGAATVHEGRWTGIRVAVKVSCQLPPSRCHYAVTVSNASSRSQAPTQRTGSTLREEAALLRQLRHPCVCTLFGEACMPDGRLAIVMELLPASLATLLFRPPRPSSAVDGSGHLLTKLCWSLAHEVAAGVAYLHLQGVVHRDLKPANVMLTDGLHAKVRLVA